MVDTPYLHQTQLYADSVPDRDEDEYNRHCELVNVPLELGPFSSQERLLGFSLNLRARTGRQSRNTEAERLGRVAA